MTVPADGGGSWAGTVGSLLGVTAWVAATTALAFRSFGRAGYGEH